VTIESTRDMLVSEARRFRDAIQMRSPDALELAQALYARLILPLVLREGEALVVVPHGMLHHVPFQALRGPAAYLVEERVVSYAPSASALVHLLGLEHSRHKRGLAWRAWRGPRRERCAGARAARGDVVLFLHADTVLPPGAPAAVARTGARA